MTSTGRNNKIVSILKATEEFDTEVESFIYDVTNPDDADKFDKLPEFIQETIKSGDTWKLNEAQPETQAMVNDPGTTPTAKEVKAASKKADLDEMFG